MIKHLVRLLPVFVLLANFAAAQTPEDAARQMDALFARYNAQTPGVAVLVLKDGKIIFKKGYGTANLEYDVPVTTKTVFNIASVSKQFTAFAVYLLEKQGKISLEDDVRKYVPEVPDYGKPIKIKHLLGHTSGIRDQWALLPLAGWRMDDVVTTEHILKLVGAQKELNFEPGSAYSYSNTGYTLAAEIVARVSGKTFAAFTKENIFNPLGMTDTQFADDAERIVKNAAYSYELDGGVYEKRNLNNFNAGASNLLTTVEDLSKWALNFEKPTVGDAEMIERFNEPSLLDDGKRAVYYADGDDVGYHAKGQVVRVYRGANVLSHGGHAAGFRSSFWRFPDRRFALILLSNDEHFEQLAKAEAIADYFLKDVLQPKRGATPPVSRAEKPLEKSNADLREYEGEYYSEELTNAFVARVKNGKLFLAHRRLSDAELTETGKDKFAGAMTFPVEVLFLRDGENRVTGFKISNFGAKNVKFSKLK